MGYNDSKAFLTLLLNLDKDGIHMDYSDYEKECAKIRHINNELLQLFENDLLAKGLSERTVQNHLSNVDFYINEYLLREDAQPMEYGTDAINPFLGYFFICKCMWSTPGTIKSTAASIKKFYKCMLDHGKIQESDYTFLCYEIKDNMEFWQADCEAYNDSSQANPFDIF